MRTVRRASKSGGVEYVQLAHNEWDPVAKRSKPRVVHSFGRAEEVDRAGIERLIGSLSRFLNPNADLVGAVTSPSSSSSAPGGDVQVSGSRAFGGAYLLDGLWRALGIDGLIAGDAGRRGRGRPKDRDALERVVFALVANRALAPSSKLAATDWMNQDVHIDGLTGAGEVDVQACYRAMDWLIDAEPVLARQVYHQVTDLLNLEVDILFFDTTSTYFETEFADAPVWRDAAGMPLAPVTDEDGNLVLGDDGNLVPPPGAVKEVGFRTWGKSKDSRDDLPQVVIGMAVTRDGIPVRVWSWPGNTTDSALIRQVHADMRDWSLSRIIYAADRGFSSAENRRDLMRGADGYILGEKLRSGSAEARAALSRPGRYRRIADNMQVKEVSIGSGDRFIICYNPEQAARDAATRDRLVTRLTEMIDGTDKLSATKRAELRGRISTMPGLNRFLRVTPQGLLRIDKAKITAETNLDGKYLLRTSDPKMSAEDVALGYKQLLQVERGWRDMKSTLDLRPVFHRLEERIRAHVLLCWLALLLIRLAENHTGHTWATIKRTIERIHAVTLTSTAGTITRTTTLTAVQRDLLTALDLPAPPAILDTAPSGA